MIYKVIGLMSGSSLDGLDIAYVQFEEVRGTWSFEIQHSACIPYEEEWRSALQTATALSVPDFLRLHTSYGRYLGSVVRNFINEHHLEHKVHFIASHGHTVFHDPSGKTSFQLGDGASVAAVTGLPVIADLRSMDVALNGQGAPIVPIGDQLLFPAYDLLLNIGGICNLTVKDEQGLYKAFDICVANQALNLLASQAGAEYDEDGKIAAAGKVLDDELEGLRNNNYYSITGPKSLSNDAAMELVHSLLDNQSYSIADKMRTITELISIQIYDSVAALGKKDSTLIVTGGGAFNKFLVEQISGKLSSLQIKVEVPDESLIMFKEAVVMALIGVLRWREEPNVLSSATGADRDSVGGAFWLGA